MLNTVIEDGKTSLAHGYEKPMVKMVIVPKLLYILNVIQIKIPLAATALPTQQAELTAWSWLCRMLGALQVSPAGVC